MKTHDDTIAALRELATSIDRELAASAFVASLSQRPGFWRAPLLAMAIAERVPKHAYRRFSKASASCAICGFDPKPVRDAPHQGGQLLPDDVVGARIVLEAVRDRLEEAPTPTKKDVASLARLFALVPKLPVTAREGKLVEAITKAKLVVGGRYDRRHVVETLGGCGILETPEHPGFTTKWTTFAARQQRPSTRVECDPPIAFWTAGHGVNAENVRGWFGHLGIEGPASSAKRTKEAAAATARASAAQGRSDARAARSTELEVGDALALAVTGGWVGAVVVGHHEDRGGRTATLVLVDWHGADAPALDELRGRRAVGFRRGRVLEHFPVMFAKAWKRRDPRDRWRWLGSGLPVPADDHLEEGMGTGIVRPGEVDQHTRHAAYSRR